VVYTTLMKLKQVHNIRTGDPYPQNKASFIQPKLIFKHPSDQYEQAAEAVSDRIMMLGQPGIQFKPFRVPQIRRKCDKCEHEEEKIQRKEENSLISGHTYNNINPSSRYFIQLKCAACEAEEKEELQRKETNYSTGEPDRSFQNYVVGLNKAGNSLPVQVRRFYEPKFGLAFSEVKIHTDSLAAKSAQSINALAYTAGNNIVFNTGQYSPDTQAGKKLLGHELTHVVQQSHGSNQEGRIQKADYGPVDTSKATRDEAQSKSLPGPVDSIKSCDANQVSTVTAAINEARTWINNVEPRLKAFAEGKAPAADQPILAAALINNFHVNQIDQAVVQNMSALKMGLNSNLSIDCVNPFWCEETSAGFVNGGVFTSLRRFSDINLCPLFFTCVNNLLRITTVVHEVAHKYPGSGADKAYETEDAYAKLTSAQALDNADSYAVFTRQVFYNGAHGPGETC
jgi:hypothetical protein